MTITDNQLYLNYIKPRSMQGKYNLILLLDDKQDDNFLTERLLLRFDITHDVIKFTNGQEALAYLKNNPGKLPELILLDINMPEMSGWEFLDHFAELTFQSPPPIICMVSASDSPEEQKRANEHPNVYGFLAKPLNQNDLLVIKNL